MQSNPNGNRKKRLQKQNLYQPLDEQREPEKTHHSYKNHLLQENYEPTTINKKIKSLQSFNLFLVASVTMTEQVVDLERDRIQIAKGSEKTVEFYLKHLA